MALGTTESGAGSNLLGLWTERFQCVADKEEMRHRQPPLCHCGPFPLSSGSNMRHTHIHIVLINKDLCIIMANGTAIARYVHLYI